MTSLQFIQNQMQAALLMDQPLAPSIMSERGVAQFSIYRIAYRARLRAALRDNYPTLPLVMGDDAFDALANAYIEAHPSTHYSLRWFGHQLGAFMCSAESLVGHPAIVDLARMEWALRNAFDAAAEPSLTAEALAAVPAHEWANLRLRLQPSVALLEMAWSVGPIWHALQSQGNAAPPELGPPEALAHQMLIWRRGLTTQWKSLTPIESTFIQSLQSGSTFGALCDSLADAAGPEQAAASAVALLREFLAVDALCGLTDADGAVC
jgi:Putative DNA-binding domain